PSPNTPSTASTSSPLKRGQSVTYVSGTICYLCLGSLIHDFLLQRRSLASKKHARHRPAVSCLLRSHNRAQRRTSKPRPQDSPHKYQQVPNGRSSCCSLTLELTS